MNIKYALECLFCRFFLGSIFLTQTLSSSANAALDLKQTFEEATRRSELVPLQESKVGFASETYTQAKGSFLPSINLIGTHARQDIPPPNSAARGSQNNVRINATQPLFRGLREFAGYRSAQAGLRVEEALLQDTRLNLFSTVTTVYYDVLAASTDLNDLKAQLDQTEKRIKDLRDRSKIGRSRKGEVLAAQSQLARLKSQIEAAVETLQTAQQKLALTTGLPPNTELKDDGNDSPPPVESLAQYLSILEARPDIEALRQRVASADEGVSIARGAHLPNLDLSANYFLKRQTFPEKSKWDLTLTATLPLFQGGIVQSQVRQASELEKQAELQLALARRTAEQEIRDSHQSLISQLAQLDALKQSVELAEQNTQEQTRDYRLGLVTNLDVLQAMDAYLEAKRNFDRTRYRARQVYWTLQAAAGRLP